MRELKFRAWNKKGKRWLGVNLHMSVIDGTLWWQFGIGCSILSAEERENIELMQYTGLKDKNGTERYEDDIIEFQYDTGYSKETTRGIIKFGEYHAGHNDWGNINVIGFYVRQINVCIGEEWNMCCSEIEEGEIIGNIYENPELMEATDQ